MQTHETATSSTPTTVAPQAKPLQQLPVVERIFPSQVQASSETNPFARRGYEAFVADAPIAHKPLNTDAQSEGDASRGIWGGRSFRMDAPTASSPSALGVQAKLTVGEPNDRYEQEADRVAAQVMSMAPPPAPTAQRQVEAEDPDEIQTKPMAETITPLVRRSVQRQETEEKDLDAIQAKCETCEPEEPIQRAATDVAQAQPDLESRLNGSKGRGSALPEDVRSFMEPRFGADFSQVRVHTDNGAVQMNRDLNAQAFTHKQDVYFGGGEAPGKDELTAHELTHVVQQAGKSQLLNKVALSVTTSAALVQRKEPEQVSMGESKSSTQPSPATNLRVIIFEGLELAADANFLRKQLEKLVLIKGEAAADAFAYRFINMSTEQKIQLQMSGHSPKLVEEIQIYLKEEILRLEYDNKEFIKQFQQKAVDVAREILGNSENQIKKELEHYGIISQMRLGNDQMSSEVVYGMNNKDAGKGLQNASSELAKKRREVNKFALKSIHSREELERFAKDSPFLIPDSLNQKVEKERIEWLNQEDDYQKLCMDKQVTFPFLAAYTTGNDAVQRLEELVKTSPDQLAQSIGKIAHEKLENIETVRGELGGKYNIWEQPHVINIVKKQTNASSMQNRLINDTAVKIRSAEDSSKLLFSVIAIGLGLLAAIPTGGSSLLAGIAAAATVVSAGVTMYGAYEHLREYTLENAANGTDFDKAQAISQEEPSMLWLALDIIAAGLDVHNALGVFKKLAPLVREALVLRRSDTVKRLVKEAENIKPGLGKKIEETAKFEEQNTNIAIQEIRLSDDQYLKALEHVYPQDFLDVVKRSIDEIGMKAANSIVSDQKFVNACSERNWKLAGTLFHSRAKEVGVAQAKSGLLPASFQFTFEETIQSGKGGSRLDIYIKGPAGEFMEYDWKTTGRSALRKESRDEMVKHAAQLKNNRGEILTHQQSVSWMDFVRGRPELAGIKLP